MCRANLFRCASLFFVIKQRFLILRISKLSPHPAISSRMDESVIYERTADDVSSMVRHAKLDERKLTGVTQALYYPTDEPAIDASDLRLLELTPHLLQAIRAGETLAFKGGLNEKLVLCSDTRTFDVKEADVSNSLLLVPHLKHSQATSRSPLKSPKMGGAGGAANRSLDSSLEEEADLDAAHARQVEQRPVAKICHEYFECREINARFRKMHDLLQMTRYSGPENEYCIDAGVLFTFEQLLDTTQCSRAEFEAGLREFRAIALNGRVRVLTPEYEYRTVQLMLALIAENSWPLDGVELAETVEALRGIVNEELVRGLFALYTRRSEDDQGPERYRYDERLVCRIVAQNILQQGLKFHVSDFITAWQDDLPEGMKIDESFLSGIGIIDRDSSVPCVRSLLETNLSTNLSDRLQVLFATKKKWTLEEIQPYIECFTTPQLTVTAILARYARSLNANGQRIYVSKH